MTAAPHSLVVGGGIMGLSSAWALARLGHRVTLLEQGPIPNPLGSSVDRHRLIRFTYGAEAGYSAMVADAYEAWDRLWADLGRTLYHHTGTLCIGRDDHRWLDDSAATLEALDHPIEWIGLERLARDYPLIARDGLDRAFLARTGGVLLADAIVAALATHLAGRGVELRPHTRVAEIDPDRARIVPAEGGALEGDHLVVAAGPWTGRLLPGLRGRVTPSRQVVAYIGMDEALRRQWAAMPMLLDIDPDSGFYLVPPVAETGLKVGDHRSSMTGDPDHDREAAAEEGAALLAMARARFAGPERYGLAEARTCFYSMTDEERFVLERVGTHAVVLAGFSGHGFKFGALLGEVAAQVVTRRADAALAARWAAGLAAPGAFVP